MAASVPAQEEGKLLSEALSTVKVQVQQMKRHLVRPQSLTTYRVSNSPSGIGRVDGCAQERKFDAGRAANVVSIPEAVLRTMCVSSPELIQLTYAI